MCRGRHRMRVDWRRSSSQYVAVDSCPVGVNNDAHLGFDNHLKAEFCKLGINLRVNDQLDRSCEPAVATCKRDDSSERPTLGDAWRVRPEWPDAAVCS